MRQMRSFHSLSSPLRAFALFATLVVACTAPVPVMPSPSPTATPSPTPTPRPIVEARGVAVVGAALVATGDFRGTGGTQVALIEDPKADLGPRITVRGSLVGSTVPETWLTSLPGSFALARAKFVVSDADADGRDDLVALYDAGEGAARLYVFRSDGSSFIFGGPWWTGELSWARARNVLAGRFGAGGREAVVVTYQDDDARMRILAFEANASAYAAPSAVYDSGPKQFDLARTRFAVGRFARAAGADQLLALAQSGSRAKIVLFEPGAAGLARVDLSEVATDYDVTRASVRAADVVADTRDELVSLTVGADGAAALNVIDVATGQPLGAGPTGWASLPAGAVCAGPTALLIGDWDDDRRADAAVLAPSAGGQRTHLLTTRGDAFSVATGADDGLLCPTWPLTGLPLGFGDPARRPVYVKIDNNPSARPHYGISKADVVYEWLVEGLTTRLAAVFQSQEPDEIGSVRSVRMTDRHVLPSLGAVLVYSGGGPEELMAINYDANVARRYIDLAPRYGWGYRVDFRSSPYNYFTKYEAIRRAIAAAPEADQPAIVAPLRFLPTAAGDPLAGGFATSVPATTATIPYRALFGVTYRYDPATRTYSRAQNGVREVDAANGEAIAARNIVVIQTEVRFTDEFGLDPAGNPKLHEVLTGSGKGVVFRDGRRQDVTWTRADVIDAFTLRDAGGEIVLLSPGQTWIHVVPTEWTISSD